MDVRETPSAVTFAGPVCDHCGARMEDFVEGQKPDRINRYCTDYVACWKHWTRNQRKKAE